MDRIVAIRATGTGRTAQGHGRGVASGRSNWGGPPDAGVPGLVNLTGTLIADLARIDDELLDQALARLVLAPRTRVWASPGNTTGVCSATADRTSAPNDRA